MIAAVPYHEVLLAVVGIACAMGARGYTRHEPEPVTEPAPPPQTGEFPTLDRIMQMQRVLGPKEGNELAARTFRHEDFEALNRELSSLWGMNLAAEAEAETKRLERRLQDRIEQVEDWRQKQLRVSYGQHALAYMDEQK